MTLFGLCLAMAAIAAAITWRVTIDLAVSSPLKRTNYRGLELPTAVGISIVIGYLVAAGFARLLLSVWQTDVLLGSVLFSPVITAVAGFGLLGLWDDVAGSSSERGWIAHLTAIKSGRATSGALKVVGGAALAISLSPGSNFGWTIVRALVIALSANLFNLLDLGPGRAIKWNLVACVALIAARGPAALDMAALAGAGAAFLVFDLRERAMLGDAGANAIGAGVGVGIAYTASNPWILVALVVLIALNVVGQRPGLSKLIEAVPPLRSFDRAGRAPG